MADEQRHVWLLNDPAAVQIPLPGTIQLGATATERDPDNDPALGACPPEWLLRETFLGDKLLARLVEPPEIATKNVASILASPVSLIYVCKWDNPGLIADLFAIAPLDQEEADAAFAAIGDATGDGDIPGIEVPAPEFESTDDDEAEFMAHVILLVPIGRTVRFVGDFVTVGPTGSDADRVILEAEGTHHLTALLGGKGVPYVDRALEGLMGKAA